MLNILKKYFFLILIFIFIFLFYFFNLDNYFTLQFLQENHLLVEEFVESYPIISFFGVYLTYLFFISCCIPVSSGFFITAGFIFHPLIAIFFSAFTGTIGGIVNILTIRKTFNLRQNKKINHLARNLEKGFKQNDFFYLILLRLIPSPYIIQNAITVFFNVSVKKFFFSTFLGIMPWAIVFTYIGAGLHNLIENTESLQFKDLITVQIILPIIGLAILIVISLFLKRLYLTGKK